MLHIIDHPDHTPLVVVFYVYFPLPPCNTSHTNEPLAPITTMFVRSYAAIQIIH